MKYLIAFALFNLMLFKANAQSQCGVYLKDSILYKTPRLLDIESTLIMLSKAAPLTPKGPMYKMEIGRGGEGVAYLNVTRNGDGTLRTTVHKFFTENVYKGNDYLVAEKGFSNLRDFKKRGLLPGFEIAKTLTTNRRKNAIYLEYIHGDNLLHMTHEMQTFTSGKVGYQLRQNLGPREMAILNRYEVALEKVYDLWKDNPNVTIRASEITVQGKAVTFILIVKDKKSGGTMIDLNPMNTVYDISRDRLVIIDPY